MLLHHNCDDEIQLKIKIVKKHPTVLFISV